MVPVRSEEEEVNGHYSMGHFRNHQFNETFGFAEVEIYSYNIASIIQIHRLQQKIRTVAVEVRYSMPGCSHCVDVTHSGNIMMTSSNRNIFRVTGPLCGEFTGQRWIPLTKASDAELWFFFLNRAWINAWVNNREAGDLRRNRAHYDVIVMIVCKRKYTKITAYDFFCVFNN